MSAINIYADGACRNNQSKTNVGAIGAVLFFNDQTKEICEAYLNTTNNRMEILAIIRALEAIRRFDIPVNIYSDSQYVVNTLTKNWAKNKNTDLWEALDELMRKFATINIFWVKGHSDNLYNKRADYLCNQAMDNYKGA